ncbi:MAG: hypothetical protein BMS9Abin30_0231 [Gammaproteobacteria bacterium]|nr:MAG: hypothetical protein BMS9Abin30_0231 [Gammaproteobacteria bacterium]
MRLGAGHRRMWLEVGRAVEQSFDFTFVTHHNGGLSRSLREQ